MEPKTLNLPFVRIQTITTTYFNGILIGADKYTFCIRNDKIGKGSVIYKHGVYIIQGMENGEPKTGAKFGQDTFLNQLRIHKTPITLYTLKEILHSKIVKSFDDFTINIDGIIYNKSAVLGFSFPISFFEQLED